MEKQQFYMITEAGIKVLTDQITDKIITAIIASKSSEEDSFLTINEAATIINLAVPTIYGLVHKNKIPFIKKGKKLYFIKADIMQWIKSGTQITKSELELKADEYLSKNRIF